ncbi:AMP-binding enzyme [Streptomyces canus]|uniref:AMP-binding enzyme n=1 Tax=Streptomyces canus TaxID=58343 RepID=UPI002E29FF75|nr:hypothetical protein [Streptomyces canus]WST00422.1 hypothetical protein OG478_51315 [Streptomyces phaeochromogenes]
MEAALQRHPDVHDAAVLGIPDDEWGQRISCSSAAITWCPAHRAPAISAGPMTSMAYPLRGAQTAGCSTYVT